jgi:hypothetical protein
VRVTEELEVLKTFTGRLHQASVIKVGCIVRKDSEYRRTELVRQRRGSVEGHELAIVAPSPTSATSCARSLTSTGNT